MRTPNAAGNNYWLITSEYPPLYGGGIATYCYHNATMMQQNGWQVTVFVPAFQHTADHIRFQDGVRIIEFIKRQPSVWSYLGYETALNFEFSAVVESYILQEGLPQLLEAQEYMGIAYFILQKKHLGYPKFEQLKVLLTLHAPSFLYNDYNRVPRYRLPYYWIGEMERWCIVAADMVNAPSQFMPSAIAEYFEKERLAPILKIPYPFKHDSVSSNTNKDPRERWFFFGKLTPQKGIFELLNAAQKLWQSNWQRVLQVIGGGHSLPPSRK